MANALGEALSYVAMGVGQGMTGQTYLTSFTKLKQDAEEWKAKQAAEVQKQQLEAYTRELSLQKDGYMPMSEFKGGSPADTMAIQDPITQKAYFKPRDLNNPNKIIEQAKFEALKKMSPETLQKYAIEGTPKAAAYQTPTWSQNQQVESVRASLKNGFFTQMSPGMGMDKPQRFKSKEEAISFIAANKLDPKLFEKELSQYSDKGLTSSPKEVTQTIDPISENW